MNITNQKKMVIWIFLILLLLIVVWLTWKYYDIKIQELDRNSTTGITLIYIQQPAVSSKHIRS